MKSFDPTKTIIMIDGSSFLYRAYYALKPMHTAQGDVVHAVYGFCRMLKKIISQFKAHYCLIAWDSRGSSTRSEIFSAYKATRQAAPSDLFSQKELIQEFAHIIGIKQLEILGIEADDLLYSAAKFFEARGFTSIIVSTDKDLGQAVSQNTLMFDTFKDALITYDDLEQKYGFSLNKLTFYFALIGDSSDNIPGVKGIGPKTAQELVNNFISLEELYNNLDKVPKERIRELLRVSKDDAFLSLKLFTLYYYDLGLSPEDCKYDLENWAKAREFFERLSFRSLLKELPAIKQGLQEQKFTVAHRLNYQLITITNVERLEELCQRIKKMKLVAVDTETDGFGATWANMVGISLCIQQDEAYYIPCAHLHGEQLACAMVRDYLGPLLCDNSIKKIMHNAKFDMHILRRAGLPMQNLVFDTLLAASLVTQDWQRIGLKHLSEFYLQEPMLSYEEIVTNKGYKNFKEVPLDSATLYAASDAHQTFALMPILQQELITQKQDKLYREIEFPLIEILYDMETAGIYCDLAILGELDIQISQDIKKVYEHIIDLIGEFHKNINLNSPKQLGKLLFEELKLTPVKKTGKKTSLSTDQEVLQELAKSHPVPALIVKYRELFKLKSTYIDALPEYISPETGRIHTNFSQVTAATGRLASSDPNMQNIPPLVRKAFRPRSENLFLSADYSQIELRVLAYLSQDKSLVHAFINHEDIHRLTASGLFQVPLEQVTSEQRQVAKRINFSILYGVTPYGLSKDLDISFAIAKDYIEKFMAQYPGVKQWMELVVEETKRDGYVTTYWGRRRYLPGIYERNKSLYELARRMAINTKGQGTAAEIMKIGMLQVDKMLKAQALRGKMLLQIHDELLLEVPESEITQTENLLKSTLQDVVDWNVPLVVTTRVGTDWGQVNK